MGHRGVGRFSHDALFLWCAGGSRVLKGVRLPPAIVVYGSRTGESQVVRFFG